jgi:LemA protein
VALYIIIGVVVLALLGLVALYNRLVKLTNLVDEAWSGIDVQLKRRYDLIPNLVETVKGYAAHERNTLEQVVQARNQAMAAQGVAEQAQAENMVSAALKNLFALAESYPDLKANQNFLDLQANLSSVENDIQMARRYFNAVTRDYNIACQAFPSVLVANAFGYRKREFFEIEEGERSNVSVSF